jgi:MFS family permease
LFLYSILIVPFGALSGYLSTALTYSLVRGGMSVPRAGALVAIYFLPQTWKFFWAPIVDTTLTRKLWYVISAATTGLATFTLSAFANRSMPFAVLAVLAVMASFAVTFLGMAVESLVAYGASDDQKGRAGGWLQAGNLGGGGLGGGAALWLMQHTSQPWVTGCILACCFMLCCLPLIAVAEPPRPVSELGLAERARNIVTDLWQVVKQRGGYLALLVVFLPIGTGAAAAYWSPLADEWHASANLVALVNGAVSGVVSAIGCLVGGHLSDLVNRKFAYLGFGLTLSVCAVTMALFPRTPTAYAVFTLLYAFGAGLCFAGFSAVTLEAIGHGVAATKYNVYASLSNMPIMYMTATEGWVQSHWGSSGLLFVEAAFGVVSVIVFSTANILSARRAAPLTLPV